MLHRTAWRKLKARETAVPLSECLQCRRMATTVSRAFKLGYGYHFFECSALAIRLSMQSHWIASSTRHSRLVLGIPATPAPPRSSPAPRIFLATGEMQCRQVQLYHLKYSRLDLMHPADPAGAHYPGQRRSYSRHVAGDKKS